MYLKLEINGEESLHPFEGMKSVSIGKSDQCDLVINDQSISRLHAKVISKGGEYYFVDMGSKEGSYLNEQMLKPKAGTPFNTFFPIRLGTHVLLYLLDEEIPVDEDEEDESAPESAPEKKINKNIYIPDSAGTVTQDASRILEKEAPTERVERKRKRNAKRPVKVAKKADRNQQILIFLLFVIIGSFFYYKHYKEEQDKILQATIAKQKLEAQKLVELNQQKAIEEAKEKKLLKEEKIEKIQDSLGLYVLADKCLIEIEKNLCKSFKDFKSRNFKEGYAKYIDTLSLTIIEKSSTEFIKNLNTPYEKEEIATVIKMAKMQMGSRYHRGYFVNKLGMRLQKAEEIKNFGRYIILLDFILSGGPEALQTIPQDADIKTFYILGVEKGEIQSFIKTSVEKAKALKKEKFSFAIKALLNSGITSELDKAIKSLEIQ